MEEKDIKALISAGLTNAQAKTYLTLLELGQTKVGNIIEKTGLQSSVVHNAINQLIDEGLISYVLIGKIKHYKVSNPHVFLEFLTRKQENIEQTKKEIEKILPRLNLIKEQSKQKTEVEVYKGLKGFNTAYIEEYTNAEENSVFQFISFPTEMQMNESVQNTYIKLNEMLIEKNGKLEGIGNPEIKPIWKKYYPDKKYHDFRYHKDDWPFGLMIFKDTIFLEMWGEEPVILRIKDKKFRNEAYKYFKRKWKNAEK